VSLAVWRRCGPGAAELLVVMVWLHVATWTMADEVMTDNTSPVDLVQVSPQTEAPSRDCR
jgi:hypothetical protein